MDYGRTQEGRRQKPGRGHKVDKHKENKGKHQTEKDTDTTD